MFINKVFLTGRLTETPVLNHTNGTTPVPVCSFSIAVPREYSDKVDFVPIVAWREKAIFACNYFKKGRRILVEGSLQIKKRELKDGTKRVFTEVVADNFDFMDYPTSYKTETREVDNE